MSNFASLGSMKKKEEDEEKKRNEFYAGGNSQGGGGSGQAILGPNNPNSGGNGASGGEGNVFDRIVKQAQNPGEAGEGSEGPPADARRITLYRNGFTLDDGPLRDGMAEGCPPENKEFLDALDKGLVPKELQKQVAGKKGVQLDIQLSDKRGEDYVAPPPPAYVAFSSGQTLGASAGSSTSAYQFTPEMLEDIDIPAVDESAPVTTLQIRSHSGKKIKIKINQSATVLQLAANIYRDVGASPAFVLSSGFPPVDVADGIQTVKEAGLVGAAVTQKLV